MKKSIYRILFVALPLISGMFLPLINIGGKRFVNLFWDSIFGLGFLIGGYLPGGLRSRFTMALGMFVWPFCVCAFLFWVSGKLWNRNSGALKSILLLLISLFIIITLERARTEPFWRFPLFTGFSAVAY